MTNEELLADLKQLMEATVSQQVAHLATKDDLHSIEQRLDAIEATVATTKADVRLLDEKLDTIQDAIGETFAHTDTTLQDHEQRLHRLEHRAA